MYKIGKLCTIAGVLLLVGALVLMLHNIRETEQAEEISADVLMQLDQSVEESAEQPNVPVQDEAEEVQTEMVLPGKTSETDAIPDHVLNPAMDMPVQEINGEQYVGVLEIPELALRLPVMDDWNYPKLKIAPCRYSGSAYQDNLVIMAHNYRSHFGKIGNLSPETKVYFTDMDENLFSYQVVEIEILEKTDVDQMLSDSWDLTLFTCTVGGKTRITVRCILEEKMT